MQAQAAQCVVVVVCAPTDHRKRSVVSRADLVVRVSLERSSGKLQRLKASVVHRDVDASLGVADGAVDTQGRRRVIVGQHKQRLIAVRRLCLYRPVWHEDVPLRVDVHADAASVRQHVLLVVGQEAVRWVVRRRQHHAISCWRANSKSEVSSYALIGDYAQVRSQQANLACCASHVDDRATDVEVICADEGSDADLAFGPFARHIAVVLRPPRHCVACNGDVEIRRERRVRGHRVMQRLGAVCVPRASDTILMRIPLTVARHLLSGCLYRNKGEVEDSGGPTPRRD